MPMTKEQQRRILAIRHGESVWNVLQRQYPTEQERYHPRMFVVDCDITKVGTQQAKQAGKNLAQEISAIDLVLISPLRRALQTATLVLENFPKEPSRVEICKEASEVMVDPCDIGTTPAGLQEEFPQWDFSNLDEYWWYGGKNQEESIALMKEGKGLETNENVDQRISSLKRYLQQRPEATIVIICHSDTIWWLTRERKHGEVFGVKPDNGEIVDITRHILGEPV